MDVLLAADWYLAHLDERSHSDGGRRRRRPGRWSTLVAGVRRGRGARATAAPAWAALCAGLVTRGWLGQVKGDA